MTDRIGQQLGNYSLVRLLGRGGYAEVYLGEHVYLGTQAALKVMRTQLDPQSLEQFRLEARTIARLEHPHIVRILDFGVEGSTPFLVMRYAPHGSLRQLHPRGTRLPMPTVVAYVQQIASALQYAHAHKLIHRDIKPDNLLVGQSHEIMLCDFGIAVVDRSSDSHNVQDMLGTISYMAPEQLVGHPCPASDQYALGVVIYEWLSGELPFQGSFIEVSTQHRMSSPPSLREKVPTLPGEVEQVVLTALAKDPRHRFPDIQAFANGVQQSCLGHAIADQTIPSEQPPLSEDEHLGYRRPRLSNLPMQPTSLIGRERETTTISELLGQQGVRLVTLTGPGGVGKTCLSVHIASRLIEQFSDGVFLITLAAVSDPTLVVPTIAQTLGVGKVGSQPQLILLQAALKEKQLLLVLDNFEQVVDAAPVLVELLASSPKLKMLVTSRVVLHVRGEYEFAVPPLALPDLKHLPGLKTLSQCEAVALFVQRAQAVKLDFKLTTANASAVAAICAWLDGLPLAIELAAARSKHFSPSALLTRLEQGLAILAGGPRDLPARQQTLRTTLAWSYELLEPDEQHLFRRLAVCVDGCSLEAAEVVGTAAGRFTGDVLEILTSLADKSLLIHEAGGENEPRFRMLHVLREFGLECLVKAGEAETTRMAHAAYYQAQAREAEPHLTGADQVSWLDRLEREHENLRTALDWLLAEAETDIHSERGKGQAEQALRLCATLYWFWYIRGYIREGRTFLERALALREQVIAPVRARALAASGELAFAQDDLDRAQVLGNESLVLFRELGDTRGTAASLDLLGGVAWARNDYAAARSHYEQAIALFQQVGDTWGRGRCLQVVARVLSTQGDYAQARVLLEESLELYRALGDKKRISWGLYLLARVLFMSQSDPAEAYTLAKQSLALCKELGDKPGLAYVLSSLGELLVQEGKIARARTLSEESVAIFKELGDRAGRAEALLSLARVTSSQGHLPAARACFEESLAILNAIGNKELIASCLEGLGEVMGRQATAGQAAYLWGASQALREAIGVPMPQVYRASYGQAVEVARLEAGEEAFAASWTQGWATPLEQILAAQANHDV